jgi:hypothetical protein
MGVSSRKLTNPHSLEEFRRKRKENLLIMLMEMTE